jgi:uncharacterized membrane protein YdjX (TVP38/TMEM64 family)
MPEQHSRSWLSLGIVGAVVGALVAAYFIWPAFGDFVDKAIALVRSDDREQLSTWIRSYGLWGPVVILGLMLAQTLIPVLPSLIPMVAAVVIYGALWGGLLAWGGLMVAAVLGFTIGKVLGPVTVRRFLSDDSRAKIDAAMDRYGVWTIVAARVSPALSTDAVSITAGLVEMSFLKFLLATAAGILPLVILIAWLGQDFNRLGSGLIWISVISVAILIAYIVWDHRRRRERR